MFFLLTTFNKWLYFLECIMSYLFSAYKYIQRFKVAQIITHEDYDDKKKLNDIALLVTDTDIKFDNNVSPVCLPGRRRSDLSGVYGKLIGM